MIVVFEKGFALRHIGHLDLMRTIQRALRRTSLPIRFSNGFNPHIQLSFAAPLSVGVVGMREIMDVPMAADFSETDFIHELNQALPGCLKALTAHTVADDFPALMALVAGSRIRVEWDRSEAGDKVAAALPLFMQNDVCIALRKTKSGENMTNIRPFVVEGAVEKREDGYTLRCVIDNRKEGSLKPAVLMRALCDMAQVDQLPAIAYRDAILARNKAGQLIALEEYGHA